MSRHGYVDDCDDELAMWRYRGMVASAIRGGRGQRMLRELLAALDAMEDKRLAVDEDEDRLFTRPEQGCVPCALGVLATARGWEDREDVDATDHDLLARRLDVARCLVAEVEYVNDDYGTCRTTDEERWRIVRAWVAEQVHKEDEKP